MERLELSQPKLLVPKASASTNSATSAIVFKNLFIFIIFLLSKLFSVHINIVCYFNLLKLDSQLLIIQNNEGSQSCFICRF